jgi:hypothetical protein
MKGTAATKKAASSIRKMSDAAWKDYVLVVQPTNLRISSPRLIAREWWTERRGAHKLPSGRIAKDRQFQGASLFLEISRSTPGGREDAALKAIEKTRKSGTLTFETPEGGSWSSGILEMLGLSGTLRATPGSRFADLLGADTDRPAGGAIASGFLGIFGKDARSLTDGVFDPSGGFNNFSGGLGSADSFDRTRIEMKTGSAVGKLEPSYTHEDFWAAYQEDVEDEQANDYMDWEREHGWPDDSERQPEDPIFEDLDTLDKLSPPPKDPPEDDGTVEDTGDGRDGLDEDSGPGKTVQILRLIGGGVKDPQPNDDGTSNVGSSFVSLRFMGGGITDPSSADEDRGSGEPNLMRILSHGGFTDPSPLQISVAVGRIQFRIA